MKRLAALLLMGVLTFTMVGCGQEKAEEAPATTEETTKEAPVAEPEAEVETEEEAPAEEEVPAEEADAAVEIPAFEVKVVTADGEQMLTNESIAGLEIVNKDIVKQAKSGEKTSNWTGVSFLDALATVGVTEFETITIEATDGYAVDYTADIAEIALLTYERDGVALGEEDGPTNTVVEGQKANLWMKNIAVITVK